MSRVVDEVAPVDAPDPAYDEPVACESGRRMQQGSPGGSILEQLGHHEQEKTVRKLTRK